MALPDVNASTSAGRGFERFRVVRRTQESESIVSFELVPVDAGRSLAFIAGQFVALRLTMPEGETLLRHYSLSGDPADTTHWRISVKLESTPPGRASSWLHQNIDVGDELELAGPAGAFICDEDSERPVILLSGGVGVTPLVSMLHRLARSATRRVYFVHACENSAVHAFADEVDALAAVRPGIAVHVCYRNPFGGDEAWGACDSKGLLTKATLQALLPLDDYTVYLCGPPGFMQANWRLLCELGIARERIHYEFFGPATVLEDEVSGARSMPAKESVAPPVSDAVPDTGTVTVRFEPHGDPIPWDPSFHSLLEMAEHAGYAPAFNCRAGLCNACTTPLLSGRVHYVEDPLAPPADGELLLCCTRPVTPVTLAVKSSPA
ncbi:FAD-binding oxidoreductase [Paraburkholderia acidicola]|uniref:FAD-binding oxidoreductase n=1 Tax=Paraburkholderia acidicola TaxID=1912599 RepID=UPI001F19CFE1|nr:FAD-binding oxidoreductase [Paraburkholderia acidicola]